MTYFLHRFCMFFSMAPLFSWAIFFSFNGTEETTFLSSLWWLFRFLCLVLLLGQNIFCPGQNWNCPRQNFCPGLKTTFFAFKSHAKWIFLVENRFPIRKFCFKWLLKAKNVLFNPGQNFYLGQFQFCPGQKIFCPSRRTRH